VDLPFVRHCVLACAFGAPSNWLQAVGRGAASFCPVRVVPPFKTTGDTGTGTGSALQNSDRTWSLEDSDVAIVRRERAKREIEGENHKDPIYCPECGAVRQDRQRLPVLRVRLGEAYPHGHPGQRSTQADVHAQDHAQGRNSRRCEALEGGLLGGSGGGAARRLSTRSGRTGSDGCRPRAIRRFGMQNMPRRARPTGTDDSWTCIPNVVSPSTTQKAQAMRVRTSKDGKQRVELTDVDGVP
jgi:hypothetical protein